MLKLSLQIKMKQTIKLVVPVLFMLVLFTQCDSVSTDTAQNEPEADLKAQLKSPTNNSAELSIQVDLEWDKIKGSRTYELMISDSETFETLITDTTTNGTSYKTESLSPNTTYFWKVFPIKNKNSGPWSDTWSFTTGGDNSVVTDEMTLITPEDGADKVSTDLEFKWNKLQNTTEYTYQLSDNSTFNSLIHEENVEGTSYKPDMLVHQKRYFWRVKGAGESDEWSEVRVFTTGSVDDMEDPNAPVTLLTPEDKADKVSTNLEFTWEEVSGVNEYEYQLSDNSTFNSLIHEANIEGTSYEPGMLVHQKKYYWRVKVAGESDEWSEVREFTTGSTDDMIDPNAPVILLTPEDHADKVSTNLEFTWKEVSGISEYEYQLSDNSSFSSILQQKTVNGTSYKPDGLIHQKRYHWRVKTSGDDSEWSEVWTFTTGLSGDGGEGDDGDDGGDGNNDDEGSVEPVNILEPENNAFDVSTEPEFVWEEIPGIMEYSYQLSENSSFSAIVEEEVVWGTTYNPNTLSYGSEYFWRVKADVEGAEWSEVNSFETETEPYTPPTTPPPSGSFVSTHNADFVMNGEVFRFAGTNAYYLPNYEKLNSGVVDRALNLFEETGVTVVRMWGFYDGFDCGYSQHDPGENVIQTSPGEYSEQALRDLDNVIAKGKDRGIQFIIPFVNYWDELGGICQYNTWAGASNPSTNMDFFINNSDTQKWFKDYIDMLLNRVNTVTGVAYKDEPAIFGWQIMNEGRNSGRHYSELRDWYQEIARYIKSIDPNHLVSTGEEGFDEGTPSQYSTAEYSNTYVLRANEGTSYVANTAIPEIDFGSAHWYPGEFGFGSTVNDDMLRAQRAWLSDHQKIAESQGKPFYIGEFGLPGWGDERVQEMYDALYQHAESIKLDGNLLWQLVADGTKCWEFGGNICYPGGRADTNLYNSFKQHVNDMDGLK